MVDIAKMCRPQNKSPALPSQYGANRHHDPASASVAIHHDSHFYESYASKISEINSEHENAANNKFYADDEWPSIEQPPAASVSPLTLDVPGDSDSYLDSSHLPSNRGHQAQSQIEDVQSTEEEPWAMMFF